MATAAVQIGKPIEFSSSTGSSFDVELREILWMRVVRVVLIGLVISAVAWLVNRFWLETNHPHLDGVLVGWDSLFVYGHLGSFALAALLLWVTQSWLCHIKLMIFVFLLFGFNLAVAVFHHGICDPGHHANFEVALLLFLPALGPDLQRRR